LSHTCERRRAKRRSGGKESGEEVPRKSLSRLAASPLDFSLAATPRALVLQREPARRLFPQGQPTLRHIKSVCIILSRNKK